MPAQQIVLFFFFLQYINYVAVTQVVHQKALFISELLNLMISIFVSHKYLRSNSRGLSPIMSQALTYAQHSCVKTRLDVFMQLMFFTICLWITLCWLHSNLTLYNGCSLLFYRFQPLITRRCTVWGFLFHLFYSCWPTFGCYVRNKLLFFYLSCKFLLTSCQNSSDFVLHINFIIVSTISVFVIIPDSWHFFFLKSFASTGIVRL